MKRIAGMARSYQAGLLIVDRTVTGEYENYTTPEQQVPDEPLPFPWETCMTMGDSWSFVPNDNYKSSQKLVQLLVKIVSRGGNFLLNIGPGPDGDWDPVAYSRLKDIGKWMAINGEGIYNSKPMTPYSTDNIYYTQSKDGTTKYAFYLSETEAISLPEQVVLKNVATIKGSKISLLGSNVKLKWKMDGNNTVISIPQAVAAKTMSQYIAVFKIKHSQQRKHLTEN
jgi:alpha-L-fucosidase